MKYTMIEDRDYILILRPNGSILYTLQPDDRTHALAILGGLNSQPMDTTVKMAAPAWLKPMNQHIGEILDGEAA